MIMNKGLEALERIKDIANEVVQDIDNPRYLVNELDIIEKELKRLEELELENKMEHTLRIRLENIVYEKSEALRIIKEKRVDFGILPYCLDLETYNNAIVVNGNEWTDYKPLTQDEFDLLKGLFNEEKM